MLQVDSLGVLRSVASLVLGPLAAGLGLGVCAPRLVARAAPLCPAAGVAATLLLVAGGAANSAALLLGARSAWRAHAAAVVLPALGGLVALAAARAARLPERAARTLTIETLVKSPTLAYVLAVKHFDAGAAAVPAAAMVSLAALGAGAASLWARAVPPAGD